MQKNTGKTFSYSNPELLSTAVIMALHWYDLALGTHVSIMDHDITSYGNGKEHALLLGCMKHLFVS